MLRFLGYYADVETRCQVFHICIALPRGEVIKNSFLCPNGTIFGQKQFSCQWYCSYITVLNPEFLTLLIYLGGRMSNVTLVQPSINWTKRLVKFLKDLPTIKIEFRLLWNHHPILLNLVQPDQKQRPELRPPPLSSTSPWRHQSSLPFVMTPFQSFSRNRYSSFCHLNQSTAHY